MLFRSYLINDDIDKYIVVEISCKGKVLAMNCNIVYENSLYTQFSIGTPHYNYLEVEKLLKCALYLWAKENGIQKIWGHKKNYQSKILLETLNTPICIGKKIWNREIYQQIYDAI